MIQNNNKSTINLQKTHNSKREQELEEVPNIRYEMQSLIKKYIDISGYSNTLAKNRCFAYTSVTFNENQPHKLKTTSGQCFFHKPTKKDYGLDNEKLFSYSKIVNGVTESDLFYGIGAVSARDNANKTNAWAIGMRPSVCISGIKTTLNIAEINGDKGLVHFENDNLKLTAFGAQPFIYVSKNKIHIHAYNGFIKLVINNKIIIKKTECITDCFTNLEGISILEMKRKTNNIWHETKLINLKTLEDVKFQDIEIPTYDVNINFLDPLAKLDTQLKSIVTSPTSRGKGIATAYSYSFYRNCTARLFSNTKGSVEIIDKMNEKIARASGIFPVALTFSTNKNIVSSLNYAYLKVKRKEIEVNGHRSKVVYNPDNCLIVGRNKGTGNIITKYGYGEIRGRDSNDMYYYEKEQEQIQQTKELGGKNGIGTIDGSRI